MDNDDRGGKIVKFGQPRHRRPRRKKRADTGAGLLSDDDEREERRDRIIQLIREHARPIIDLHLLEKAIAAAEKTAMEMSGGFNPEEIAQIAATIYGARDRHR